MNATIIIIIITTNTMKAVLSTNKERYVIVNYTLRPCPIEREKSNATRKTRAKEEID